MSGNLVHLRIIHSRSNMSAVINELDSLKGHLSLSRLARRKRQHQICARLLWHSRPQLQLNSLYIFLKIHPHFHTTAFFLDLINLIFLCAFENGYENHWNCGVGLPFNCFFGAGV
ncbi:hypothetical protein ACET3Z_011278 [Daucus carota]